jgi:hypothetical protein
MIPVMRQAEPWKLSLKQINCLGSIHQVGIFRQAQLGMETPDQVEAEGVERADPHRRCGTLVFLRNPVSHLPRGLVRKGEDQDALRIDIVREKPFDTRGQSLRLAGAWSGFEEVGRAAPTGGGALLGIERPLRAIRFIGERDGREEQRIEKLLRHDLERSSKARRDARRRHPLFRVEPAHNRSR